MSSQKAATRQSGILSFKGMLYSRHADKSFERSRVSFVIDGQGEDKCCARDIHDTATNF